jgi:hypothetical protein
VDAVEIQLSAKDLMPFIVLRPVDTLPLKSDAEKGYLPTNIREK